VEVNCWFNAQASGPSIKPDRAAQRCIVELVATAAQVQRGTR
jgi:hypothetical protein